MSKSNIEGKSASPRTSRFVRLTKRLLQRLRVDRVPAEESWSTYLRYLNFSVPGNLRRENVWCMDYAIARIPANTSIVEIGSFCGLSTNTMTYLKERHGKTNRLVTCDPWTTEGDPQVGEMVGDSKTVRTAKMREFVKESFLRNARMFSGEDLPWTLEMISDDFFVAWEQGETLKDVFDRECTLGGPIGFCYIDGNHSYDFSKRDFENCDRHLEAGGFILFDDSGEYSDWESRLVAKEVSESGRYELIAKCPNYFFRKRWVAHG